MLDTRSRVTIIGSRRKLDLALPSTTPIGEYTADLAKLCGQEGGGVMPPAWSLCTAGAAPLPLSMSLAEAGVPDGQVLYLRNIARDPASHPVVDEIEDLVADGARRQRGRLPGSLVAVSVGLCWLILVAVGLSGVGGGTPAAGAAILALSGLLLVSVAWGLHQRSAAVPAPLRLAIALAAVPCLGAAGGLFGRALIGPGMFWAGAIVGANVACLMALASIPEAVILALEVPLAASLVLAPLAVVPADGVEVAAAAAVIALVLAAVAKPVAGAIAAWSVRMPHNPESVAPATTELLRKARHLLTATLASPAVALVVALPVLAGSGRPYAMILAGAVSVALLIRAGQSGFSGEVVLLSASGSIGVLALLTTLANRYLTVGLTALFLCAVGLGIVATGVTVALLRGKAPDSPVDDATGGPTDRPDRGRPIGVVGMLCTLASAPLALGVFGVFHELAALGRQIIG